MIYAISADRLTQFTDHLGISSLDWEARESGTNVTKIFREFSEVLDISNTMNRTLGTYGAVRVVTSRSGQGFRVFINDTDQFDVALTKYENVQKFQREREEIQREREELLEKLTQKATKLQKLLEENQIKPDFFEPNYDYVVELVNFPKKPYYVVGMIHLEDPQIKSKGLTLSEQEVDTLIS